MAYIYNIPQPTDQLSNSQTQILANFTALGAIAGNSTFGSTSLNTVAGFNYVFLANQGMIPPAAFVAGNVALYQATDTATTQNELYISKTNFNGTVKQVAATESILGVANPVFPVPPGNLGTAGWTMLPSGIKMIWGCALSNGTATQITLIGNQVFATTILSLQLTVIGASTTNVMGNIRAVSFTANSFTVVTTNPATGAFVAENFMYLAIGY